MRACRSARPRSCARRRWRTCSATCGRRRAGLERGAGVPDVKLHLYGKTQPRRRRKMGPPPALADTVDEAVEKAIAARDLLT